MNLQDGVLNQVRKENGEVRVVLLDGTELKGSVKGFDNFTVVLVSEDQQHLIYKHAIAHLQQSRGENNSGDWKFGIEVPKTKAKGKRPGGNGKATAPKPERSPKSTSNDKAPKDPDIKGESDSTRNESFNSLDFSSVKLSADEKS